MRVVMPYTLSGLDLRARSALLAQAPHLELIDCSASPVAYFEAFRALWADAETFLLVEHDVVIAPGTVAAFEACPELWCSCRAVPSALHPDSEQAFFQCVRWRNGARYRARAILDARGPLRFGWTDFFCEGDCGCVGGIVHPVSPRNVGISNTPTRSEIDVHPSTATHRHPQTQVGISDPTQRRARWREAAHTAAEAHAPQTTRQEQLEPPEPEAVGGGRGNESAA